MVMGKDGQKLSKQNGARALDTADPLACLQAAGRALQLPVGQMPARDLAGWLAQACEAWRGQVLNAG